MACDLFAKTTGLRSWGSVEDGFDGFQYTDYDEPIDDNDFFYESDELTDEVRKWLGLEFRNPTLDDDNAFEGSAAALNDGGMSFSGIADLIEKKYLPGE